MGDFFGRLYSFCFAYMGSDTKCQELLDELDVVSVSVACPENGHAM